MEQLSEKNMRTQLLDFLSNLQSTSTVAQRQTFVDYMGIHWLTKQIIWEGDTLTFFGGIVSRLVDAGPESLSDFLLALEKSPYMSLGYQEQLVLLSRTLSSFTPEQWNRAFANRKSMHSDLSSFPLEVGSEYSLFEVHQAQNDHAQSEEIVELAKRLLMSRHMRDGNQRVSVLGKLPAEIRQNIVLHNGHNDFANVLHLIKVCSNYPDGLEQLAYALYQFEGDSPEWRAIDQIIRGICSKIVTYTRLQQLQIVLTQMIWPNTTLKQAYTASIPQGWSSLKVYNSSKLLWLMLDDLAKAPQQNDRTFPIITFVEYLAYYAEQQQFLQVQEQLRAWSSQIAGELGMSAFLLEMTRSRVQDYHPPATLYLLVAIEAEDEQIFNIQAWLLDSQHKGIVDMEVEDDSLSLEHLPVLLDKLLLQCDGYLSDEKKDLIIEFFLPNELFCHAIDRLPITAGVIQVELGIEHKVVIRSLKRAWDRRLWRAWKAKWGIFQEFLDGRQESTEDISPLWIGEVEQCKEQRSLYAVLHGSSVVCLGLTFMPSTIATHNVFDTTLSAGIPIALWPREQVSNLDLLHDLFESLLGPECLLELPQLIWKHRLKTAKSGNEHHLILLWDDPNRLPPTMIAKQLAMPLPKKGAEQ